MTPEPSSDEDVSTSEAPDRIPIDVKWDLTTAPLVFKVCNEVVKAYYLTTTTHFQIDKDTNTQVVKSFLTTFINDARARNVNSFLTTWTSKYGWLIILFFWIYGATTPFELIKLFRISKQTVNNNLINLESFGFIEKVFNVKTDGPESWIYQITIADSQAAIDAKIRYDELKKQKRVKDKARKREGRHLLAAEMRRKGVLKAHLEGALIQSLVTEFSEQFKGSGKPVSFTDIERRARKTGISDYLIVAIKLEEKHPKSTGYYKAGKLDPTYLPPEIKRIREARG